MNTQQCLSQLSGALEEYERKIKSLEKQLEHAIFYDTPEDPADLLNNEQKENMEDTQDHLNCGELDILGIYHKYDGDCYAADRVTKNLFENYSVLIERHWDTIVSQYENISKTSSNYEDKRIIIGQIILISMGWF